MNDYEWIRDEVWVGDRYCNSLPILAVRADSRIRHTGGQVRWVEMAGLRGTVTTGLVLKVQW